MPHPQRAEGLAEVTPPALRHQPAERRRKSGPALRAFFNIAERWGLDPEEQRGLLGWPSRSALYKWKASAAVTLPYDTLVRLSLILGIFKALHILYPEPGFADAWMKMPNRNALFGARTPLEYALRGGTVALQDVRRLLDARRGGWS
ncbi:MAG TPA: MbcA/ParS/Xre antitoxin family protein [Candidatus Binatia bacterium]|nr:MbcA/ParS/Xre antitoxin family protein [Candidatus Binatia bacterium]